MNNVKIAIIDYDLSNVFSVVNAIKMLGYDPVLTTEKNEILTADAVILPGVGAFQTAMKNLEDNKLIEPIITYVNSGKPFMGICLGLQLLFDESEEFGNTKGLSLVKGKVVKFEPTDKGNYKVPQISWNKIIPTKNNWQSTPFQSLPNGAFMYFVHSYYVQPEDDNITISSTTYGGISYCSSIISKNIFATQFHPEKSGKMGLTIYKNWLESI